MYYIYFILHQLEVVQRCWTNLLQANHVIGNVLLLRGIEFPRGLLTIMDIWLELVNIIFLFSKLYIPCEIMKSLFLWIYIIVTGREYIIVTWRGISGIGNGLCYLQEILYLCMQNLLVLKAQLKRGKISTKIMSNELRMIFARKLTHENRTKWATHDIRMKSFNTKIMRKKFSYNFHVKIMRNSCENFRANFVRGSFCWKMMRKFRMNFVRISYEIHAWHICLCSV